MQEGYNCSVPHEGYTILVFFYMSKRYYNFYYFSWGKIGMRKPKIGFRDENVTDAIVYISSYNVVML